MDLNIQIFGTPKCTDTNKALRFFKERGLKVHFVNLIEKPISKGELKSVSASIPLENLLDRDGREFKNKNLEYMVFDLEEKLLENPLLLKTPIVRNKQKATSGYEPEIWKKWIKDAKND